MPAKPAETDEPERTPAAAKNTDTATAPAEPATDDVPAGRLPGGVYEFTGTIATQYLEVPLTAYPADPGRPAGKDDPGTATRPATVFHWPFTAPDDGRWQPSKKKPNTLPDNAPANSEE